MIIKIIGFAIVGLVLLLLIKQNSSNFAVLVELVVVVMVIIAIIPEVEKMLALFNSIQGLSSVSGSALKILFKAFGILALGAVVSDVCRDNGEGAVAGVVDLSVKMLAISCALPVFRAVIEIALTFFNR